MLGAAGVEEFKVQELKKGACADSLQLTDGEKARRSFSEG